MYECERLGLEHEIIGETEMNTVEKCETGTEKKMSNQVTPT